MAATAASERGSDLDTGLSGSDRIALVAGRRDEQAILDILVDAGVDPCPVSLAALSRGIGEDSFAAAILTEEKLQGGDARPLREAIERQPALSSFPFIVIADRSALPEIAGMLEQLGEAALVERPPHPIVLGTALRSVLGARARQREAAAHLIQGGGAEEHLRELTTTLEARVRERMRELRDANRRLVQEVRDRHAAEERLRESEELYRYTVELSKQIVWTSTPNGKILTVNPRFHEVTGISEEVKPHEVWLQLLHPEDRSQALAYWGQLIETGESQDTQFRMRVADGSYRTFLGRAMPRRDEEGRIIRWYGFTEDVTDRMRAENERREAEERYRLAAKATNDIIWDMDVAAKHINWIASENAFFGYPSRDEMTSLKWWQDRVHRADRRRVIRSLDAAIAGAGSHWEETYRFLKANGEHAEVFDQGFIIRDDAGQAIRMVGAISDLSEYSRAEAEIRKIQAELIHVSRVSAMGTMASTLAHELNQPLTAVSSYIRGSRRLLDDEDAGSREQVRAALEAAEGAALRAGHIVRRLRELVARGNVSPRPEPLAKVIQDASLIAFLDEHLFRATHRIDLDPEAEWVEVDPIQIQQVVINLVRNALQALDGQAQREILIRTSLVSKATAEVSITDTGPGIPAEVRDALFSPFQSTKLEGMGIGLSISRTIVEAHGGKIWAEDAPEGGTVFRFTLPRVQAPDEDQPI